MNSLDEESTMALLQLQLTTKVFFIKDDQGQAVVQVKYPACTKRDVCLFWRSYQPLFVFFGGGGERFDFWPWNKFVFESS